MVLVLSAAVQSKPEDYDLKVNVARQGEVFKNEASFRLPLNTCQAYRFITDYDAATQIPGVLSSQTTRLDKQRVRVERVLRELSDLGFEYIVCDSPAGIETGALMAPITTW